MGTWRLGGERYQFQNYCAIQRFFKICYLVEEDGHIYFFNFKEHRLLKKIKLFDYQESLAQGLLLVNSLLLEEEGYMFIVLQFSKNKEECQSNHEDCALRCSSSSNQR